MFAITRRAEHLRWPLSTVTRAANRLPRPCSIAELRLCELSEDAFDTQHGALRRRLAHDVLARWLAA